MSQANDENQTENDIINNLEFRYRDDGKRIIGDEKDQERFNKGDLVQVFVRFEDQFWEAYPNQEIGVVQQNWYEDDEYYYCMPCVQLGDETRMFNPDHLVVIQRADGSPGEVERLEEHNKAYEEFLKRVKEAEK